MANEYGYLQYHDYAFGALENSTFSSDEELQTGSTIEQFKWGTMPFNLLTFEQDAYITRYPAPFFTGAERIGFLTKKISDENGVFKDPIVVNINFGKYFSMSGLTIFSRSVVKRVVIEGYRDGELVESGEFSATSRSYFYPINLDLVNSIKLTFHAIATPYHFFGLYSIDFGRLKSFFDSDIESVKITSNFSVLGDTIEYDTLDLSIVNVVEDGSYLFQRKQPIYYIDKGQKKLKFYIDSGEDNGDGISSIFAYDDIANLEDDFLGGLYNKKPVSELLQEILSGKAEYVLEFEDTKVTGYIPVCTRRKALQMVLMAANLRCYKGEKLIFKPLESVVRDVVLNKTNIIGNPQKSRKQPVRSVSVKEHNYSKGTQTSEVHHWYLSKTESTLITFPALMHSLQAFEVTGVDEFGNDIISDQESANVTFLKQEANYCIVSNSSDNKIVIIGSTYSDSVKTTKMENTVISQNEVYYDFVVDMTLHGDVDLTCEILYDLYSRKNSIRFKTLENVDLGGLYDILGEKYHIKKKKMSLDGIYEVEAV